MLRELDDLDVTLAVDFVALNEAAGAQLLEQHIDIAVVVRQDCRLDALRAVLKPAGAVGLAPEPGEQDARERIALGQVLVLEVPGLDVA